MISRRGVLLPLSLLALNAHANVNEAASEVRCRQLQASPPRGVEIISAKPVPAGVLEISGGSKHEAPGFCRVSGVARPTSSSRIGFEVWLPLPEDWNGRYHQYGEGADGGRINELALVDMVRDGSAAATTDDGNRYPWHTGKDIQAAYDQAAKARESPQTVIDLSYRGSYETTRAAKAILRAYYGRPQQHSYFRGCSGGGTQALRNAQRYPEEWDGILVGAPANNTMGYFAANAWNGRLWADPQTRIPASKLPAIQRTALASCSKQAYVYDGIASDPRHCHPNVHELVCQGAETDDCLTRSQADSLQQIYSGPRHPRTGAQIYAGLPPTMERAWAGWLTSTGGAADEGFFSGLPFGVFSANLHYRYVFSNPAWNVSMMDFDRDLAVAARKPVSGMTLAEVMDAVDPDLSRLSKRGGKILMYFGWGDAALSPLEGIAYYQSVVRALGSETPEFFRLFMVPGMHHCTHGPGANAFGQQAGAPALRDDPQHDILRALEAWAESGRAPDRITAVKYVGDDPKQGVAFTRVLCPYPQVANYHGTAQGVCIAP